MSHFVHQRGRASSLSAGCSRSKDCRRLQTPPRVRRDVQAERLEGQWRELRRHATIERDPGTMLWLRSELDRRKRQAEAAGKHDSNS
jgi:hypothetical protein